MRKRTTGQKLTDTFSLLKSGEMISVFSLFLLIILALPITVLLSLQTQNLKMHVAASGHIYYVSKNGNNADGSSWQTAWNELKNIHWSIVLPGDTILLDGGQTSMTYTTTLTIGKSGVSGLPITIARATDSGHNGKVVLFGGRSIPLPYCNQPNYTFQKRGVRSEGINMNSHSWITVDGMSWDGISIHGYNSGGIAIDTSSPNNTFRNIEAYDNGSAYKSGSAWSPAERGDAVKLYGGTNLTFQYMDLYDNSDDNFESDGPINNMSISYTWAHETREDPTQPGTPWNQCVHQDGFQIYNGGDQGGILIQNSIFGPGLKEGTILENGPPANAQVKNVTIKNVLFTNKVINIMGRGTGAISNKKSNWNIDHVTVFGTDYGSVEVWLKGSGIYINNSIFYGGHIWLRDGLTNSSNNCQWNTNADTAKLPGQTVDPKFVTDVSGFTNATPLTTIANANFALQSSSPCKGKGTSITSIAQFLSMVNSQPFPERPERGLTVDHTTHFD